ncbi:MAG: ABC transporter ATP-binding protein, partial [Alphaproteobacteria bacterium]
ILDDLDFSIGDGELRVLLGPNGAGKTTLIDIITGRFKPVSGKIYFEGRDITGMPPDRIFGFGVSRKFQVPNMYETLSVFDNLMVSLQSNRRVFKTLFRKVSPEESDRIWDILEMIGLEDKAGEPADTLSHGERQWLELGMMVGSKPKLMLLDEPTTGMTEDGKHKTAELIKKIAKSHSVLLVEHDMHIVRQIADIVTVLHQGQLLAEGPLAEVVANETVQEVYLGKGGAGDA